MTTYKVTDANSSDTGLAFDAAVSRIAEWYEDCDQWSTGEGNDEAHEAIAAAIASVDRPTAGDGADLQDYADSICQAVAQALGHKDFAGHGSYFVSAAARGGFLLTVEAETEDEAIEVEITFHDSNPNASSGSEFASLVVEIASWDEVEDTVRGELLAQAAVLDADMGYSVGDTIWATWEDEHGCNQEICHSLTAEDLGASD